MDWWSLFRNVRRITFVLIALTSLIWAIVLSVYLSKEWNYFTILQRSIVLALIGVNGVTAILLYLMIVVVFRMWKELLRMIFLLMIHIGTAIPFTLFGVHFSCSIFDTQSTCTIVDLAFLATAWTITGLLVGYTIYLCIMSRVSRPFPLVIHNDLLSSYTPSLSRNPSVSSINSKTGLLGSNNIYPTTQSPRAASVYSQHSYNSASSRTIPKRLFVVNPDAPPRSDSLPRVSREQLLRQAPGSYGAMGSVNSAPTANSPGLNSRFSASTIGSTQSLDTPPTALFKVQPFIPARLSRQVSTRTTRTTGTVLNRQQQAEEQTMARVSPRPLLLSRSYFMEQPPRDGTPESVASTATYASAPPLLNVGHLAAYHPIYPSQISRYGSYISHYLPSPAVLPPQLQPGSAASASESTAPPMVMTGPYAGYSGAPHAPARLHTATSSNASIHSVVPSVHSTDEYGQPLSRTLPDRGLHVTGAHWHTTSTRDPRLPQPANMRLGAPPHAHLRNAGSEDPVWRPYSAGARMITAAQAQSKARGTRTCESVWDRVRLSASIVNV